MSSWKKYGGKDKFDNMTDLTVKTLVCENLVMRNKYLGDWSFTGELIVSKDATIGGNLYVGQNADISGNLRIRGALLVEGTDISGTLNVSEDLAVRRNIYLGPEPGVLFQVKKICLELIDKIQIYMQLLISQEIWKEQLIFTHILQTIKTLSHGICMTKA